MKTLKGTKKPIIVACGLLIVFVGFAQASANQAVKTPTGSISGTIQVVRTKVKTGGAKSSKDVVVFLEAVGDRKTSPAPTKPALMDQKGLVFIPHVLAVQKGTPIEFLNNDNDKHNVYFVHDQSGQTKDIGTWQPGESRTHTFEKHHELLKKKGKDGQPDTMIVLCKLHLEMAAYIVLLDNHLFSMAAINGDTQKARFNLKNVPAGTYKLNAWHKTLKLKGGAREIVVKAGQVTNADLEITKAKYAKKK